MNFNSRISTKGLKKTGDNEWYDTESRQTFYKDKNGNLKMKVDDFERKRHKAVMERLRYYERKYNVSLKEQKKKESKLWSDYTRAVKDWNSGKINRANTVGRRYRRIDSNMSSVSKYFNNTNKTLSRDMAEKRKVQIMRIDGKHDVFNGLKYDEYIKTIAERLQVDESLIEQALFPKGLEEYSKYDEIKAVLDNSAKLISDYVKEKIKDGTINEKDAFFLEEILLTGDDWSNVD